MDGAALTGQPVSAVRSRLRQRGLAVQVRWQPGRGAVPGTVRSVYPAGWRPVGSTVLVTGALAPASAGTQHPGTPPGRHQGQGKHHGKSHGNGHGHGHGGPPPDDGTALTAAGPAGAGKDQG